MAELLKLPFPKVGDPIRASDISSISKFLEPLLGLNRGEGLAGSTIAGGKFTRGFEQSIYNIPVYNTSESEIPAYGIIRPVTSESNTFEESGIYVGDIPNTWGSQDTHLINGPEAIPADEVGLATNIFPCQVLYDYDNDLTPTIGSQFGPRSGSCKGRKLTGGFRVMSVPTPEDIDLNVVWALRTPIKGVWCKPTADIALNSSGTADVYWGTPGAKTTVGSGGTITIWAVNLGTLTADTWVFVHWTEDARWESLVTLCAA